MLAVLLALLACPPTSIADDREGGHFLASPYGVPQQLEPVSTIPRTAPEPSDLPLWDLDATAAELEAILATPEPPSWAHWVAWAVERAREDGVSWPHLIAALSADTLTAEQLGWWRSLIPTSVGARDALREAFDLAKSKRTRAMLAAALALAEYEHSCPVPTDVDGACRAASSPDLLVRRRLSVLEQARAWAKQSDKLQARITIEPSDIATAALFAELELARAIEDYESLLAADAPDAVPGPFEAFFGSYADCWQDFSNRHSELLWVDVHSTAVILLRQARTQFQFADMIDEQIGIPRRSPARWRTVEGYYICERSTDSVIEQADAYLELCVELTLAFPIDPALAQACQTELERFDLYPKLAELVPEPHSTTIMHSHPVVRL